MGDTTSESNSALPTPTATTENEQQAMRRGGQVSFSIWPPSDRTRETVRSRLVETLSKPSILSKRYGTMPSSEAEESAQRIEAEAYDSANSSSASSVVEEGEDGMEVLQAYSKEISRLMLDAIKSRSSSSSSPDDDVAVNDEVKEEEQVVVGSVEDN